MAGKLQAAIVGGREARYFMEGPMNVLRFVIAAPIGLAAFTLCIFSGLLLALADRINGEPWGICGQDDDIASYDQYAAFYYE